MPSNKNEITLPNDKLLARIIQLVQENEALKFKLNASIPDPYADSNSHHHNIFAFLEQTNQIAHVGGWEIDLINNKVYWTSVTRQIHEVEEPYEPTLESAISYYKEGTSRDTITTVVNNALKNGDPFDVELQIITAKGNERWVRAKGRAEFFKETPIRIVGAFQDINEEKIKAEAYRQMQDRFEAAFNHSALGMALVSKEGKWVEVNKQLCTILGYSKEELLATSFQQITHPDDVTLDLQNLEDMRNGKIEHFQIEKRYIHKTGHIVWVLLAVSAVKDTEGNVQQFFSQTKDISYRKAMQTALQQSEQEYKSLFDQNPAGVFSLNAEGCFTSVNDAMVKNLGYPREQILNAPFYKIVKQHQLKATEASFNAALMGNTQRSELEVNIASGDTIIIALILLPIVVNDCITGLFGIATDITIGKKLKRALIESENNLRAIFESTGIGQIMMDTALTILSFNTAAANYTLSEHKKELEVHQHFLNYFPLERHDELMNMLRLVLKGEKINYEKEFFHDFGGHHWFNIKFDPVVNEQGLIFGILMTIENITQQKIATELIKTERNQLRTLIDNIPDAIYIKDNNARKTITNNVDLQLIGALSEDAVLGKTDLELFEGEVGHIGFADDMQIITTGIPVINKEQDFVDEKGDVRWLLTTKVPLRNELHKITGLLGIGRDITQQKKDQAAIKKSNERFEYVTKATFDAIWDWDISTNELYRGEGYETIFGYNLKTFKCNSSNWDELIHPEDKEKVLAKFNAVLDSSDDQWQDEYRFLKADGSYAYVRDKAVVIKDETGKSIRMIGAMQDITIEKQEEQQLRLFESVLKTISDAVIITDAALLNSPDGPKILFVNDAFVTTTGYTKEEAIGQTPRMLQGPKTDRKELDKLNAAFKKWEPVEVELINYKKNREEYWVNISIVPLANEKGCYTHLISIQKDITVKKRAEEELKVFYEIVDFINSNDHFDIVLSNVIKSIATYLQFDFAEAWSVNFDNSKMVYRAKYENREYKTDWSGYAEKAVFVKGQGLSGIALEQKKIVYWEDLQHSPSIRKESAAKAGLTSGMALPVLFNGEVVAVFNFYSKSSFTKQQLTANILNKVSNELGAGIQKNRAEAELNSFFSLSPDMLCIIGTDGFFKKVNPAFTNIIGYSEQEFLTKPKIKFVHPDDCEKTNAETNRLLNGGQPAYFENRYISKNKSIVWLAWSFTAILDEGLVFAVAKDITYKKKLEQERTRILESISDYFYALDANFNFTYINSEAKKLLQPYEDSLLGKNIWEVFPLLKESEFYINAVNAIQRTEPIHFEFYEPITCVWYEESFYPTEDGLSVFFRSVNGRKQSEAKLTELNKVLAKNASEMAASNSELERFAYVASHDLQEPLRMVSGFMQLLLKKYEPVLDENGKKYINFAIDGAARMKTLIHDLLHYSRAGAGELVLEPVDMNEVMADVKMILKTSMTAAGATLIIEELPIITANILMATQLLQNLVSNAIKYKEADVKPIVNIRCTQKTGEWEFSVQDNGIGVPEGYEEKIFEVFHRLHTKQEYSGTGIGLSICKKIVEKFGGKIWAEPNIASGSVFKFTILA